METEPKVTLRSRPIKQVTVALFCAFTAVLSLAAVARSGSWFPLILAGLSVLGVVGATIQALPGRAYLSLTVDGFEVRTAFQRTFISWADVSEFRAVKQGVHSVVGVDFTKPVGAKGLTRALRAVAGAEGMLPDTYGCKPRELAKILNNWKAGVRSSPEVARSRTTG